MYIILCDTLSPVANFFIFPAIASPKLLSFPTNPGITVKNLLNLCNKYTITAIIITGIAGAAAATPAAVLAPPSSRSCLLQLFLSLSQFLLCCSHSCCPCPAAAVPTLLSLPCCSCSCSCCLLQLLFLSVPAPPAPAFTQKPWFYLSQFLMSQFHFLSFLCDVMFYLLILLKRLMKNFSF